jgi:hypothetical protein
MERASAKEEMFEVRGGVSQPVCPHKAVASGQIVRLWEVNHAG